jgi:pimeloyl-ACP methyl ester carboxylesterase
VLTHGRGASGSTGHTSWSAKPELGDYVSVYGFMLHYLNDLILAQSRELNDAQSPPPTVPSAVGQDVSLVKSYPARLILAGYSYGSMVASHLPNVELVIEAFQNAPDGSAESEIQLRASHLASQTFKDLNVRQERIRGRASMRVSASDSNAGTSHPSSSVRVGGFESEAAEQRIDREPRRSLDVRRSLDRVREKIHPRPHRLPRSSEESDGDNQANTKNEIMRPQVCYLLVSPVLPPVAAFATFFSSLSFTGRSKEKGFPSNSVGNELAKCPTVAVYGSKDFFTSVKKLRNWAEELAEKPGSLFQHHQIDEAGHFWRECGVLEQLKNHIRAWEASL